MMAEPDLSSTTAPMRPRSRFSTGLRMFAGDSAVIERVSNTIAVGRYDARDGRPMVG